MPVVLDSSLVLATMIADRRAAFAKTTLADAFARGASAPVLLSFEVANVLCREVVKGALSPVDREGLLRFFSRLMIRLEPPPDASTLVRIGELAERHALTGYDATFLELALRLGSELATLDADLAAAGRANGLAVHHTR